MADPGREWGSRGFNCEESMSAERERLAAHISEANAHFWSCCVPEAKSKQELKHGADPAFSDAKQLSLRYSYISFKLRECTKTP